MQRSQQRSFFLPDLIRTLSRYMLFEYELQNIEFSFELQKAIGSQYACEIEIFSAKKTKSFAIAK